MPGRTESRTPSTKTVEAVDGPDGRSTGTHRRRALALPALAGLALAGCGSVVATTTMPPAPRPEVTAVASVQQTNGPGPHDFVTQVRPAEPTKTPRPTVTRTPPPQIPPTPTPTPTPEPPTARPTVPGATTANVGGPKAPHTPGRDRSSVPEAEDIPKPGGETPGWRLPNGIPGTSNPSAAPTATPTQTSTPQPTPAQTPEPTPEAPSPTPIPTQTEAAPTVSASATPLPEPTIEGA